MCCGVQGSEAAQDAAPDVTISIPSCFRLEEQLCAQQRTQEAQEGRLIDEGGVSDSASEDFVDASSVASAYTMRVFWMNIFWTQLSCIHLVPISHTFYFFF
jgi:hypothetical protein